MNQPGHIQTRIPDNKDAVTFSEYIKNLRLERNLSLLKVKKLSGLPINYLRKIEKSSQAPPGIRELKLLSEAYDVSLFRILRDAERFQN